MLCSNFVIVALSVVEIYANTLSIGLSLRTLKKGMLATKGDDPLEQSYTLGIYAHAKYVSCYTKRLGVLCGLLCAGS